MSRQLFQGPCHKTQRDILSSRQGLQQLLAALAHSLGSSMLQGAVQAVDWAQNAMQVLRSPH